MITELYNYDIYPKVVPVDRETEITVRPLGGQSAFPRQVTVGICPLEERIYPLDATPRQRASFSLSPDADGCLRFRYAFRGEQEHYVIVSDGEKRLVRLSVYSVEEDLAGRIPLLGDQHLHTIRSDGREDPAIVAAHMRSEGYDYIAVTDHGNYFGSLECMDAYRDVPVEMHLMAGEEVHLPDCYLHCVHIGGRYSVNALVDTVLAKAGERYADRTDWFEKAFAETVGAGFPGTMTDEAFRSAVEAYADTLPAIPEGIPRFVYAGFCWICDQIRKAGGLSIFPHPYWIVNDCYHADERLTQYLFEQRPFDAFEILGGERYYQHNGFQTVHYYEAARQTGKFPVVGSSDSHSTINNPGAHIGRTITFARENSTPAILDAIRAGYTAAVDSISAEERIVGEYRFVKYGWFLWENYFPLHRAACFEQGRAMKEYHCGDREEGRRALRFLDGRIARMWRKYFAFDRAD